MQGTKIMAGQPTLYREEYNNQAYKLCLLGHTDAELAVYFEVTETTINNWKLEHPKFFESIKKGKAIADGGVAESLYKSAMGYEHPDTDIRVCDNMVVETPITKYYPPNATSLIFWLKNRQPKKWRDKQEVDHTTNGNDITTVPHITIMNPNVSAPPDSAN